MRTAQEKIQYFSKVLGALNFIKSDIKEGIQLAKAKNGIRGFIYALALLCYTEYAGKIKNEISNVKDGCEKNFNTFFELLGPDYKKFLRENPKTYDIFRCGLAHEYYTKKFCRIEIRKDKSRIGIRKDSDGIYCFNVEKYFEDFIRALKILRDQVANETVYK
jgi:hypothetical protein